ncbi:MAG: DUF3775 domain-containing protein [Gammaproteobacteria bacterium]
MFNINNEIICAIILKAKEINIEEELFLPGDPDSPETDDAKEIVSDEKVDLTTSELRYVINELEPDQQRELIALMYVGRGDYEKDQWSEAIKQADNIPAHQRADYLLSKEMFADYLTEGLAKFGYSCDE